MMRSLKTKKKMADSLVPCYYGLASLERLVWLGQGHCCYLDSIAVSSSIRNPESLAALDPSSLGRNWEPSLRIV